MSTTKTRTSWNMFVYLLVALAVILLVATVFKPTDDEMGTGENPSQESGISSTTPRMILGWIMCGIPILATVGYIVVAATQQRKLATRLDQVRFEQVPDYLRGQTPPGVQTAIDILTADGFTRIGEVLWHYANRKDPIPVPILLDANKRALVLVNPYGEPPRPALSLETLFADGFLLYTYHPIGMTINQPYLRTSAQPESIEAAITQHLRFVDELQQQHGGIYPVSTLADREAWWTAFGALHKDDSRYTFNPVRWLLPPLVIMIASAVAWFTPLLPPILGTWVGFSGLLLLVGWGALNIKRGVITFHQS